MEEGKRNRTEREDEREGGRVCDLSPSCPSQGEVRK